MKARNITAGAALGSVLGQDLWNITYDGVPRIKTPEDLFLIGYANDIAAIIQARILEFAQMRLTQLMRRLEVWMQEHGFNLAMQKTEILILTRKRIQLNIPFKVGEETILNSSYQTPWNKPRQ